MNDFFLFCFVFMVCKRVLDNVSNPPQYQHNVSVIMKNLVVDEPSSVTLDVYIRVPKDPRIQTPCDRPKEEYHWDNPSVTVL